MNEINSDIWVEKYRPHNLSEVVGHEAIIERLKVLVSTGNSMHMLFSGPPATGKTATAIAFAKELYGTDWKVNFKEMNASDDRGIDSIRNDVKSFAQQAPVNANFKIIFLDEVDELTGPAQSALRRIMEKSSRTCRFILSCNFDNKLISPIHSRLAKFYFGGLNTTDMTKLVDRITTAENIKIEDSAKQLLIELSDMDARTVINTLQIASMVTDTITDETISQTLQVPDKSVVRQMVNFAIEGDVVQSFEIMTSHIINTGFDVKRVLKMLVNIIPEYSDKLPPIVIIKFYDALSTAEDRINSGNSIDIQMKALLSKLGLLAQMDPVCLKHHDN